MIFQENDSYIIANSQSAAIWLAYATRYLFMASFSGK